MGNFFFEFFYSGFSNLKKILPKGEYWRGTTGGNTLEKSYLSIPILFHIITIIPSLQMPCLSGNNHSKDGTWGGKTAGL